MELDSVAWVRDLNGEGQSREQAVARLHALLLRVAHAEAARRRSSLPERGQEEVEDLCREAASEAVLAVLRKLPEFRGDARFTTWACKFVILEISSRLRRHAWRHRRIEPDERVWERLADAAQPPLERLEWRETLDALGRAVREELTERQRVVFEAAVLREVPIDVLAERFGSTRGAIYKILHDARVKLRQATRQAPQELQ
jgi:RNA polymerase sigma-70 factor (ECF subfamily)